MNKIIFFVLLLSNIFSSCEKILNEKTTKIQETIILKIKNNSFCSIRNCISSIKDASKDKIYNVIVPKGLYYEIDIRSKDFINLIGENKDSVIIYCNGDTSLISPSDYTSNWGNKAINRMKQENIHCFWVHNNFRVENVTVITKRGKYCVHQDDAGDYTSTFENCKFIGENVMQCIGIGSKGGQFQQYINCEFITSGFGIGWHNWNNQTASSKLSIINCSFSNDMVWINELGSTQNDTIELQNCFSNNNGSILLRSLVGYFYGRNHLIEKDPLKIPYCINLILKNTNTPVYKENRPNSIIITQ